jgi:hypothetical protein
MRTAPVVLTTEAITIPLSGAAISSIIGLRNNDAVGVLIDQIEIQTGGAPVDVPAISLRYKGLPLTNGWVLAAGFCSVRNDFFDSGAGGTAFKVRLSKPVYLGPGEWLDVSLSGTAAAQRGVTYVVSAQGRFEERPAPSQRWLPYFAVFQGAIQDGSSNAAFALASSPQDLGNPFADRPLLIEQIVARVLTSTTPTALFASQLPSTIWDQFNVRISDDQARWWVPVPTPMQIVANALTRAWRINYSLPPSSFLRVEIEGTATWAFAVPPLRQYALPIVGMVGYRQIEG